ncbi:ribosome maturation factor RimM [Endozoicomonas atrinae]|uniref:ribosome maturation factor RimM n=1 Tax=Endozoicomonas atrinae TaxID=1333660 RepID=UPI000A52A8E1|nr:ribosome maturation factor RimM [Endozoicomonas atrinae]
MTKAVEGAVKRITLGHISSVFGVKGWLKIHSNTSPMENILNYPRWILDHNGDVKTVEIDQARPHGKGLIAHIVGCDDRELARSYCGYQITINADEMPEPEDDEIYWHQLESLDVFSRNAEGDNILLGKVSHLMETGANDVLVIRPSKGSIDRRERLVPWLTGSVVLDVNPEKGFIRVDWDPEF